MVEKTQPEARLILTFGQHELLMSEKKIMNDTHLRVNWGSFTATYMHSPSYSPILVNARYYLLMQVLTRDYMTGRQAQGAGLGDGFLSEMPLSSCPEMRCLNRQSLLMFTCLRKTCNRQVDQKDRG